MNRSVIVLFVLIFTTTDSSLLCRITVASLDPICESHYLTAPENADCTHYIITIDPTPPASLITYEGECKILVPVMLVCVPGVHLKLKKMDLTFDIDNMDKLDTSSTTTRIDGDIGIHGCNVSGRLKMYITADLNRGSNIQHNFRVNVTNSNFTCDPTVTKSEPGGCVGIGTTVNVTVSEVRITGGRSMSVGGGLAVARSGMKTTDKDEYCNMTSYVYLYMRDVYVGNSKSTVSHGGATYIGGLNLVTLDRITLTDSSAQDGDGGCLEVIGVLNLVV
eukprot:PhF_6_TR13011/c0_g1_i2/m.20618